MYLQACTEEILTLFWAFDCLLKENKYYFKVQICHLVNTASLKNICFCLKDKVWSISCLDKDMCFFCSGVKCRFSALIQRIYFAMYSHFITYSPHSLNLRINWTSFFPWDACLYCSHLLLLFSYESFCIQFVINNWKTSSVGLRSGYWLGKWNIFHFFTFRSSMITCAICFFFALWNTMFCRIWLKLSREYTPVHLRICPVAVTTSINWQPYVPMLQYCLHLDR